jgi:hypothetical protein
MTKVKAVLTFTLVGTALHVPIGDRQAPCS